MVLVPARITDYYTAFLCNMPRFMARHTKIFYKAGWMLYNKVVYADLAAYL
jgi:hypothetical protein